MAGTLTVQNLQGPASGANANKVILPAGHTLDTSGGTLVPSAGQVLQVKQGATVGTVDFNQSLTVNATIYTGPTITPVSTSSKILIMAQHSTELATGSAGSVSGAYYVWTSIYEGNTQLSGGINNTGSLANAHGHYNPVNSRQGASGSILYSPNTTSPLTFYIKCSGGSNVGSVRWLFYGCAMTVMEIAG
jgi:hypothetical protein